MARSYSAVIADTSLEERRASVIRHAENTVSNKGMKETAIRGLIINSEVVTTISHRVPQDWFTTVTVIRGIELTEGFVRTHCFI